jgi:sialate O-acetylesterase
MRQRNSIYEKDEMQTMTIRPPEARGCLRVSFLASLMLCHLASAEVRLPALFSSHMVFQQQIPIVIWGWAQPNETVTVQLGAASKQAQANERGEWKAILPAMSAGGPYALTVSGSSTVSFEDILVGEVWLCSGQSNMEMGIGMAQDGPQEIAAANYPNIRLLKIPKRWSAEPQTNFDGAWKVCTPSNVAEGGWSGFSATGYYFGRHLCQKLGVPVGLIDATWGGTRIESWTPPEGFAAVPALKQESVRVELGDVRTERHEKRLEQVLHDTDQWLGAARAAMQEHKQVSAMPTYPEELLPPHDVQNATALFNGMIYQLRPFGMRGAIWYQGESNMGEGMRYMDRMKALIGGWREIWGEGDFPFYYVQIAPYNYGGNAQTEPELWEAQTAAQSIPDTGMVVVNDIASLKDIHPRNKQEVGRRLALWALANTYSQSNVVYCGPTFKSMSIDGEKLSVAFDHIGAGLKSRDGQPVNWFEIIDAEHGGFVQADAQIDGATIMLSAPGVNHPVAMRFAWSMLAVPNLINSEGLPAGAFRAGVVPKRDLLAVNVPEARDYHLVYDLDLSKLGEVLAYDVDDHSKITQPFDRVAYFLELQTGEGDTKFVYVSMDAFTQDAGKIGVPTFRSGAFFQQPVNNLNVFSNVKGIATGSGFKGGNIEFWPNNYSPENSAKVPNASDGAFDFGDKPGDPQDGYGSMQVHNHDARQTIFALNHWRVGSGADLGIGNQTQKNPDWTFAGNAGSYEHKRLRVLVRYK